MKKTKTLERAKKFLPNETKLIIERFKNIIGLYNSDINRKHDYLKKLWLLGYRNIEDDKLFKNLLRKQISSTELIIKRLNFIKRKYLLLSLYFLLLACIVVIVGLSIPSQEIKMKINLIIYLSFPIPLVFPFFAPSEKKISTVEQYLEILKRYNNSNKPLKDLNKWKMEENIKSIYLPFTPAELAALFGSIYANNEVIGLRQSHIAYFIENYCLQKDGSDYKDMPSMISRYKGDDVNSSSALTDFINKLNQKRP